MTNARVNIKANARGLSTLATGFRGLSRAGKKALKKIRVESDKTADSLSDVADSLSMIVIASKSLEGASKAMKDLLAASKEVNRALKEQSTLVGKAGGGGAGAVGATRSARGRGGSNGQLMGMGGRMIGSGLGAVGGNASRPFAAQAGVAQAMAGAASSLPFIGAPLAILGGVVSSGLNIIQQRVDRASQFQKARFQNAPTTNFQGFNALGISPEAAMAQASAFTRGSGGFAMGGRKNFLRSALTGVGAGALGAGAGLGAFGGSMGLFQAAGLNQVMRGATGTSVNATATEQLLQDQTAYLKQIAMDGIDISPQTLTQQRANLIEMGRQVGLRNAAVGTGVFGGGRGLGFMKKFNQSSRTGQGTGGMIAMMTALQGGGGMADVFSRMEAGIGGKGGLSMGGVTGTIQSMFGKGGSGRDMMDVMLAQDMGISIQQAMALRRGTASNVNMGAAGRAGVSTLGGRTRAVDLSAAQLSERMTKKTIKSGSALAKRGDANKTADTIFAAQTAIAEFAMTAMPTLNSSLKLMGKTAVAVARAFFKTQEMLGMKVSIAQKRAMNELDKQLGKL